MPKDPRNPDDVNTEAEGHAADATRYRVMYVRDAIYHAFSQGGHPYEVTQQIKDGVGLSTKEWRSLDNFANRLIDVAEGSATEAKEMEMLGRVGGKTAFRKVGLTNDRVQVLINKYQDTLLRRRAEGVARTVTIDASNEAQGQLWKQAAWGGDINSARWKVTWIVSGDDRTCPHCLAMKGKTRTIEGTYENGVRRPTLHPSCRCCEGLVRVANSVF